MKEILDLESGGEEGFRQLHWLDGESDLYFFSVDDEKSFEVTYIFEKVDEVVRFGVIRGEFFVRFPVYLKFITCR